MTGQVEGYRDFAEARGEVVAELRELATLNRGLGMEDGALQLEELADRVQAGVFRVLVLGEFKRGKSTLINALLGANLLPANVTPTTALLTLIKYGPEVKIELIPFRGEPQEVSVEQLAETLSLSTDEEENHRRQATYKLVEVRYPSPLCQNNVEIVDSPGLNESAIRTEITSGYIRQSDAAIFVLSATNFASLTELEYLNTHILGKGLTHIFFAINQYDRVLDDADDPAREARDLTALAEQRLGPLTRVHGKDLGRERIYFVSAKPALRARMAGDATGFAHSRLSELEGSLERFLARERGRVALERPLAQAAQAVGDARDAIAFRRATMETDLATLENRVREVQPKFDELQEHRKRILRTIESAEQLVEKSVELSFRQRVATMEDGMLEAAMALKVSPQWNPQRIRKEMADGINKYIERELQTWSEQTGREIEERLSQLTTDIGQDAASIDAALKRIRIQVAGGVLPDESEVEGDPNRVLETILAYGGGMLGDFGVILKGGSGWLQSALRVIALQIAATVLLAAIGWATNPLFVIGTVASAVTLGIIQRRNTMERNMKEKIAETARAELHKLPAKSLPNMLQEVHKAFDAFASSVARGIDVMIANVRDSIDAALADRRALEGEQAPELERLTEIERGLGLLEDRMAGSRGRFGD
jgi:GTPase SAR1 family protein